MGCPAFTAAQTSLHVEGRAFLTQAVQQRRDFKLGYMPARLTDGQQANAQALIGADGDGLGLLPDHRVSVAPGGDRSLRV